MSKKYKITVHKIYTGDEMLYRDFLEHLESKLPDHIVQLLKDKGGAMWSSTDPDGSTAETTYRVEES